MQDFWSLMDEEFLNYNAIARYAIKDIKSLDREDPRFLQIMKMRITTHHNNLKVQNTEHRITSDEMIMENWLPMMTEMAREDWLKIPKSLSSSFIFKPRPPEKGNAWGCHNPKSTTKENHAASANQNSTKLQTAKRSSAETAKPGAHAPTRPTQGRLTKPHQGTPSAKDAMRLTDGRSKPSSGSSARLVRRATCRQPAPVTGANIRSGEPPKRAVHVVR
jgi:hypothetical protein